ncbi:PEGA domain-containing protein [Candidatus Saccharibacteria bacterium]|nr:PEGA domain-containing protein [Candidatus Saccharibacteria bacterium]
MDKLEKIRRDIERTKKNELLRRILKYVCMCLGMAVIFIFCIMRLSGNRFDFINTDIKATGLLEVYSHPSGANAHIYGNDGFYKGLRTNDETVLDVGSYAVKFSRDGYRDWYKEVSLSKGQVLWLNYAVMIPEIIKTDEVANVTGPILDAKKTRDNKWILLELGDFSQPTFDLLAVDDPTNVKITSFKIPDGVLSKPDADTSSKISIVEGDTSSRYYLLRHDFTATGAVTVEYIYFDRRDLKTFRNITRDFAIDIKNIAFSQRSDNQFYIIDDNDHLRRIDYGGQSMTAPLIEHVLKFTQYDDKLVSISLNDKQEKTVGITYGNGKYRAIQTYTDKLITDAYFTNYYNVEYLVILHGDRVEIVQRPLENSIKYLSTYKTDFTPEWISLNASGRFILVGGREKIDSYDQELKQHKKFSIAGLVQKPTWLDDFYLFVNVNGNGKVFEFDGDNLNEITDVAGMSSFALFSPNKRYLFSLGASTVSATDKTILQRSKLLVD